MIYNFIFKICNCIPNWSSENFIKEITLPIIKVSKQDIKNQKIITSINL